MEPLCRGDRIKERYEVLKVLAGGMGYIYVAYDHEHREAVAIKAFQDEYVLTGSQSPGLQEKRKSG